MGKTSQAFWKHMIAHYNKNWPPSYGGCLARNLETKWGCIKHDMMKFFRNYHVVVSLDKSDISNGHRSLKVLQLYKSKNPNKSAFNFIHYWLILKYISQWSNTRKKNKIMTPWKGSSPQHNHNWQVNEYCTPRILFFIVSCFLQ